jgi:hypothetical protein
LGDFFSRDTQAINDVQGDYVSRQICSRHNLISSNLITRRDEDLTLQRQSSSPSQRRECRNA